MRPNRIIVAVTNDLVTDQRVDRVCRSLVRMGFEVLLVGRKRKSSLPLKPREYRTRRMRLLFGKGPWFYADYNLSLFLLILFSRCQVVLTNDLDTLPGGYLAAKIRRIPHIHDCHEYFRGVPELNDRSRTSRIWKYLEDRIFPKLRTVYAVNASVAGLYKKEYGNEISVIRNVPLRKTETGQRSKAERGIPEGRRVLLYQGALNI
ncbi:MAG TPA: glycosyltransferase family 4 protein, partial [Bacteroidales bacterium]|nr:glycosyltransferase family 4 protein [Bacteroidales bacterium]